MGAPSKRAKKTRQASEFDSARLAAQLAFPRENSRVFSWSLSEIRSARDMQMLGQFQLPARLAEAMRTDDALFTAFQNRLAPQRSLCVEMVPKKGAKGESIAAEASALFGDGGVGLSPDTLADIHGCLVNHGVAFGYNIATTRDDGSRTDFLHCYWPIEYVRWNPLARCFTALLDPSSPLPPDASIPPPEDSSGFLSGLEIPIVHGDGRWVVYQTAEYQPWKYGVLLAAALVWARHAFAIRDWSKSSLSHGLAKVVGELPPGVDLQNEGGLTPEAAAMQQLLQALVHSEDPTGIRPAGSKTEFIANNSTAWQIFTNLAENAEKAAARIYLGTDGILGTQGGAPGVDISELFGVASTIVQGDLDALTRGIKTGLIDPWCAMNFATSDLAPTRMYLMPDPDEDRKYEANAARGKAFHEEVAAAKANGFAITQEYVDKLAKKHGVDAPMLPAAPAVPVAAPVGVPAPAPLKRVGAPATNNRI